MKGTALGCYLRGKTEVGKQGEVCAYITSGASHHYRTELFEGRALCSKNET